MVSLHTVRARNASLMELRSGLVAVFVGGTSGIGEATAREFVRHAIEPRVYLVGRNEVQALRITEELRKINPDSSINFIKCDVSLLRNVDIACRVIKEKDKRINLLFMSPGFLSLGGHNETTEGLDKMLTLASSAGELSRVVSVFGAGKEGKMYLEDMSLKTHYGLRTSQAHLATMNSFAVEEFAKANPGTTFIHNFPGIVKTNITREFGTMLRPLMNLTMALLTPWTVGLKESGERQLYAATSNTYSPRANMEEMAVEGSDGVKGSGAYLLTWDGSLTGNRGILAAYRAQDVHKQIWDHTLEIFDQVCGEVGGNSC